MNRDSENGSIMSVEEYRQLRVRGKPLCPFCKNPLSHIYDDMLSGHISLKCKRCGKPSMVDVKTMEALMLPKDIAV